MLTFLKGFANLASDGYLMISSECHTSKLAAHNDIDNDTLRLNTVQFEIQSIDSYLNNDLHQVYALITFGTSKISLFFLELL